MSARSLPAAPALVALAIGLSSCHRTPTSNLDKIRYGDDTEVASVCASPETLEGLKAAVFSQIDPASDTPTANPAYKDELAAGGQVSVEAARLDSFDRTTRQVSCSAKVTFAWPDDLANRLRSAAPTRSWGADTIEGTYSIEPQADGTGLVYVLSGPINDYAAGSVTTMLRTLAEADADAQAAAEAAAKAPPPPPPPPSDEASDEAPIDSAAAAAALSEDANAAGDTSVYSPSGAPSQ